MKNSSSAQRGTPMPGGRSQVQFRATRIRRVAFHWHRKEEAGGAPAPARGRPRGGRGGGAAPWVGGAPRVL